MIKSIKTNRAQKGQALAEGTAFLVLLTPLFVGLVLLLVNTCLLGSYQQKLQVAAIQAAQSIDGQRYYMGAFRPDYNEAKAKQNARQIANAVLQALGMPNVSRFQINRTQVPSSLDQGGTTVTSVTLSVQGISLAGGWVLPFPLSASGASSFSNQQAWRVCQIHFADISRPGVQQAWRTIQVPCYNFMTGSQPTGSQATATGFPYATPATPSSIGFVTVAAYPGTNGAYGINTYAKQGTTGTAW